MLNVRYGLFETNSSECHALIIPNEQGVNITKTIDLSSDDDKGDIFRKLIRDLRGEEDAKLLANWFYRHGVENIIYNGSNSDFIRAIKNEKIEFEKNPDRDLGRPNIHYIFYKDKVDDCELKLFFGTENREYYGHDGYLSDYDAAYILLGGG